MKKLHACALDRPVKRCYPLTIGTQVMSGIRTLERKKSGKFQTPHAFRHWYENTTLTSSFPLFSVLLGRTGLHAYNTAL